MKHIKKTFFALVVCSGLVAPWTVFAEPAAAAENSEMTLAKQIVENGDCVKAFQIFQKYASAGDAEAQAWLGRCYMNATGTSQDVKKAYEWFAKAAGKNNPWAINGLGVCYNYGVGVPVDLQKAMEYFKKAAEMNLPLGYRNLAKTYADKNGGFWDLKQAEICFKKAVELNALGAKADYAQFLFDQKRFGEAVSLLQQLPENEIAMTLLTKCYLNGWGVPVNIAKALDFADKCVKINGPTREIAELYYSIGLEELFVKGDRESAKKYFKRAAEYGNADAQYIYASILYDSGDLNAASRYAQMSADKGCCLAPLYAGKVLKEKGYLYLFKDKLRYDQQQNEHRSILQHNPNWRCEC